MKDHLPDALRYNAQGFRPIATIEKIPMGGWEKYQHQSPTAEDRHRWWPGTGQRNPNIALVLGPACHLLVLNVNVKHGRDGRTTLKRLGWELPPTPTICTPTGGLAYLFRPSDPARYPSDFRTYVYPAGYDGLEFRGAGGIQLVPPSCTKDGAYAFLKPWTLTRIQAELADLPECLLQAWLALDRGAEKFARRRARDHSRDSQTRTLPASAHTTNLTPPPTSQRQSQLPPAPKAPATTPHYTTITTRLSTDGDRLFVDGFDLRERECAAVLCQRMDLDVESLEDGRPFLCRLPGHREREPSAMWGKTATGYYLYKDWHQRSGEPVYTVPEVFAALTTRRVLSLPKPSRMAWRLRLMVEEGWLEPTPVAQRPLPDEASELLRRYVEGFRLLIACRSCHPKTVTAAAPFTKAFAARWCGIPEGSVWSAHQEAIQRDLLVFTGMYKGQALYRLGKDE